MVGFHPCACPPGTTARVPRARWMRILFPSRVLYTCGSCGRKFLLNVARETDMALRDQAARLSSFRESQQTEDAERTSDPAQAG